MHRRTIAVLVITFALLASVFVADVGGGVSVDEQWISDTARENRVNHHAATVGPNGTVLAPVAAVANTDRIGQASCSLVRLAPEDGGVEWRGSVPPANCTAHAITAPAIGDADGDGDLEAAVVTTEQALVVRTLRDGSESWRISLPTYGYGRPTIETVDGEPAVVAVDIRGSVVVARDGAVDWRADLDEPVWAPPIVADLDADQEGEVAVVAGHTIAAYGPDGDAEWQVPVGGQSATAADVDADPAREVMVANGSGVTVVDGADGTVQAHHSIDGAARLSPAWTTESGHQRVSVGIIGGTVAALDPASGAVQWRTAISDGEQLTGAPRVADVTGDGRPSVVAVANDGVVAILDPASGEQLASYERDVPIWTHASTGDIDGDGAAEVIVRYGDGRVVRLDVSR